MISSLVDAVLHALDDAITLAAKSSNKTAWFVMIDSLVDAVLHTVDDAITPAAYWVLELLDSKDDLQQAIGDIVSADKIHTFQETVRTPFVALHKENISSRFETHDIVSALAICSS